MIYLLLLSSLVFAQPKWTSIMDDGYLNFRYGDGKAEEPTRFEKIPGPFEFRFPGPPAPERKVCAIENRPGVFWYTPQGKPLNHTFTTPNPTEYRVSSVQTGMRGFEVSAKFSGAAKRAGAVEVVYFADRSCSDGTVEYGFSRDLATESILVYWATFANCGNDAASLCRKTDDGELGDRYSNVQQEDGGPTADHGFRIYGLKVGGNLTYRMFAEGQGFRVEVRDVDGLTACSEAPGGKPAPCTFWKKTDPWFPIHEIDRGYIIAGTQRAGDPELSAGSELFVSDIRVAK